MRGQNTSKKFMAVMVSLILILTIVAGVVPVSADETAGQNFSYHTVKNGETITSISKSFNVDPEEIKEDNGIKDGNTITAGQILKIRTASPVTSDNNGKISLDVRDADIRDVLSLLALSMDCNVIFTEEASKVNISLKEMTPMSALEYVLKSAGLDYLKNGNTIIIGKEDNLTKEFFNNMVITRFALRHITADNLSQQIDKLGIKVQKITLDSSDGYIWVQGMPKALAKVRELIAMLDRAENFATKDVKYEFMPVPLQYITPDQMAEIIYTVGIEAETIALDSNPKVLWVYGPSGTYSQIDSLRKKVDIKGNEEEEKLVVMRMSYLTYSDVISVINQLDLNVNVITLDSNAKTIWLKGEASDIEQAKSVIAQFDVITSRENRFFVYHLTNINANEAKNRIDQMNLKGQGVVAYPFNYKEITNDILLCCPLDYKTTLTQIMVTIDVAGQKIKIPIDYSDETGGDYRLRKRRDLLSQLTGIDPVNFMISSDVSRTTTPHYVMWIEDTPDNIQKLKDIIAKIDAP